MQWESLTNQLRRWKVSNSKHAKRAEEAKRRGAGMAAATRGRKTTFTNRKRKANKKACRGKQEEN